MPKTALHRKLDQKVRAIGPVYVGQVLAPVVEDDQGGKHSIVFLPDKNNPELRAAGRPMHFYYLPSRPRLARHSGGDFVFHLQKFSGIMDPTKNIGEDGHSELAGGVMNFTATLAPPEGVAQKAFEELKKMLPAQDIDHYKWSGGAGSQPPVMVGPIPLKGNQTVVHNLKFSTSPEGAPTVTNDNPDAWAFEVQGEGEGALNIHATNAFTAMLGRRPVNLLWSSAQSGTSQVTMENHISYDVWQLVTKIKIEGDWEKIHKHFSSEAKGGFSWFRANASHEVNSLVESGAVKVQVDFGAGMTDASRKADIEKAADVVADKIYALVEQKLRDAGSSIQQETAAQAPQGAGKVVDLFQRNFWVGLSVGVKNRKDVFKGTFVYEKEINEQVTRSEVLSSQMEGLFDETSKNEEAFDRYFSEVFMEESFRKVHVVASANANWPSAESNMGDPIRDLKIQIGYPDSNGSIVWKPAARFKEDINDADWSDHAVPAIWREAGKNKLFVFEFTRHDEGKEDDEAEVVHIRKTISFLESPDVAMNQVTEEYTSNEQMIEVRAESSGELNIGPISLDMPIGAEDTQVSVLVRVRTHQFGEKSYLITGATENDPRHYRVWYESPDHIEAYEIKTEVSVKGRRFGQKPLKWESAWQAGPAASGPVIAEIPAPPADIEAKLGEYLG